MYQHVNYEAKGSFAISHKPTGKEKELWVILHGYGQLAPYFLRKFESQFQPNRLFIAPEATNYGYLKGFSGRVGANWMTKHERETAIQNNHRFLNQVLEYNLKHFSLQPFLHIFGFSQGSATATRWAAQIPYAIKSLVLWGGGFAHDIDFPGISSKLRDTRIFSVLGDEDSFLTEKRMIEQEKIMPLIDIKKETIPYHGGHDIYPAPLEKIVRLAEGGKHTFPF